MKIDGHVHTQEHHNNYNRCYNNYPMKVGKWIMKKMKMNIAKTKVMVVDNTPINVNNVRTEDVECYIIPGAALQPHYSTFSHQVFNLHVLRYCASSIVTCFSHTLPRYHYCIYFSLSLHMA